MTRRLKPSSSKSVDEIEKTVFSGNVTIGMRVSGGSGNKILGNKATANSASSSTLQSKNFSSRADFGMAAALNNGAVDFYKR